MKESDKFEFCSKAWIDYARTFLRTAATGTDLTGIEVTFNEVFTDAPKHLALDKDGRTGWYLSVRGGTLDVKQGILDHADMSVIGDYTTILPLARMVFDGNPELAEKAGKIVAKATEDGLMRSEGDGSKMAGLTFMGGLHDALAKITA